MREKIIIYGAGRIGKKALYCLKDDYDVMFFIDSDESKWGTYVDNLIINPPSILSNYCNTRLVIASSYFEEILKNINIYSIKNVEIFQVIMDRHISENIIEQLDKRTINLGCFFGNNNSMLCRELTFLAGGSGVLDYFFLKQLAIRFNCAYYLEIGTYIGESINILSDVCKKLYSITAPLDAPYSMNNWCKKYKMPDYSERLAYSPKITHYYTDSKEFDYSKIPDDIDLYFIDGDHSYAGVYSDTKNIFKKKKKNAIIVWHDFKKQRNTYNVEVVQAVYDVLGEDFSNVYVTDNNICGVYIPDEYKDEFELCENKYETDRPLYVYDTELKVHIIDGIY